MLNLRILQISPLVQRGQANRSIAYPCEKNVGLNTSPRGKEVYGPVIHRIQHGPVKFLWERIPLVGPSKRGRRGETRFRCIRAAKKRKKKEERTEERRKSTTRRRHHRPPPPAAMAMRPLARLRHQLSPSLLRLHGPRHGWPPASDATFLWRGLASSSPSAAREKSSRRTLGYLLGVAVAMVGASYAAVPLYRRFCQATGYGGTTQRREVWTCPHFRFGSIQLFCVQMCAAHY